MTLTERTAVENQALLAAAIERSGLSVGAFARDVMIRDPRTIRAWLSGDKEIPQAVLSWLHLRAAIPVKGDKTMQVPRDHSKVQTCEQCGHLIADHCSTGCIHCRCVAGLANLLGAL